MAYTWKRRGDAWQIGRERLTNSVGYIRPRAADQFVDIVLVSFAPTDRFVLLPATHAMPFETVFRTHTPHSIRVRSFYRPVRFIGLEKWNWYDQHYRVFVFWENNRFNNNSVCESARWDYQQFTFSSLV